VCVTDYVSVCAGGYWRVYVEDVIWALMWTPAACVSSILVCVCVCVCVCSRWFSGLFQLGLGESYNVVLILLNIFDI